MSNNLNNPFGKSIVIERYPPSQNFKSWDAADELILEELKLKYELKKKKLLIVNDSFGALSCSLSDFNITTYIDSFNSSRAIIRNSNSSENVKVINDLNNLKNDYDLVIIKVPKSLSFLEDILATLTSTLLPNTPFVFGGMVKYLTKGYFDIIAKYIGETTTSLAKKKARLIFSTFTGEKKVNPYPQKIFIDSLKMEFTNHSDVFSRSKLDIGTRFFLEHIPTGSYSKILDLGSANGIIGIQAKRLNPTSKIIFTDESFMAVKSSKENYDKFNFNDEAHFLWGHCFQNAENQVIDLVLCNPPFHQVNALDDAISTQMFNDAKNALPIGGQLRAIGNLHLGYHQKLKVLFGNSKIIAKNKKFMIVDAFKK